MPSKHWYLAWLVGTTEDLLPAAKSWTIRRYSLLYRTVTAELAYARVSEEGPEAVRRFSKDWTYLGISDLFVLLDSPEDGGEILWSEDELTQDEVCDCVRPNAQLIGSAIQSQAPAGWYIAKIVMEEVHDSGRHSDLHALIWTHWKLIRASSVIEALERSLEQGRGLETPPSSHRCNGDSAHFEFRGLADLIPTLEQPADGSVLYFEEFARLQEDLKSLVSPKKDLRAFQGDLVNLGQ